MTGKQLRAFIALAETLSFAAAADRIHMSQPALSLSIQKLEGELGGRLLTRTTRQVRLTPEGETLLPRARQLLADWEDTEEMLRQRFTLQRGHVTVAAMPSFAGNVLPEMLAAYRRRYPHVDVSIHDVVHEHVLEMVTSGRVELGIAFEPEAAEQFHFVPLFVDRFIAALPQQAFPRRLRQISWPDLIARPFITLQRPSTVRRLLEQSLAAQGIELQASMECHQLATVGELVAQGLGVSAVPGLCAGQMQRSGAHVVHLRDPLIERAVGLIMRRQPELSTAARAMHDIAIELATRNGGLDAADR